MPERKTPQVRFKGFTDTWEQRKLEELVEKYEDPIETPHNGYTRLGIRSHARGTFHEYVEPGHELETAQMHRVAANKLIFNITFAWEHAVAITGENDAGRLVSHRFPQFTLSDSLRSEFLKYVILDEDFHHNLYLASPGGAGRNRVLKIDEALDYPIYYPSVDEQCKIGAFLDEMTELITLHQRECERLQMVKKSMLENCFPKNGEKVPRFRFAGFTGDWEQRKLSDFAQRESTIQISSPDYPSVEYEDIVAEEGRLNKDIRQKDMKKTGIFFDGTEVLYGKLRPYLHNWLNPDFAGVAVGDWWVLKPVEMDKNFLYRLIQTRNFDEIANQSTGSKMPRADWNLVSNAEFGIPSSLDEQRQIAEVFDSIDHLITLHQSKLEMLKKIKESMLGKMLV